MMNHLMKGKEMFLIHSLYVRKPTLDRSYVVTGQVLAVLHPAKHTEPST